MVLRLLLLLLRPIQRDAGYDSTKREPNRLKALGELELPGEDSTVAADSSLAVTASLDA